MFKSKLQKFETLVNLLHNSFVNNKNIIVFIGNSGTYLGAVINNKFIDSLFIPLEDRNNIELYKYFFKKYSKFYVFFLHDDESCELRHEPVPVLQSVVKVNPIEKFIEEHFSSSDIIAYNVYNITTKTGETWNSLIAKAPYQPPLSTILNYILDNSLKFGGIYYLGLEYITIINKLLRLSGNDQFNDHLQIFAYITKANAIKFVIKHRRDIVSIKSVPYPSDKSELYIQGIIEQEISDYLISYKNYIAKYNLQVCIIFLVSNSLKSLLQETKFEPHKIICLSNEDITLSGVDNDGFSDVSIIELFANNKTFLALNKAIKSIIQINLVSFLIFKPLSVLIIALLITLINIKLGTFRNIQSAEVLDAQNYQILQEYRNIRQKYPTIKDVANIADLYSLTALLKVPILTPFDFLEKFLTSLDSNVYLDKISWKLIDSNNIVRASEYIRIDISLKYIAKNSSFDEALTNLNLYIDRLENNFNNFTIEYQKSTFKVTSLLDRIIIPVSFSITGPKEL